MFKRIKKNFNKNVDSAKSNIAYHELQGGAKEISSMVKVITNTKPEASLHIETFEEARLRRGTTDAELVKIHNNFTTMFYVALFATLICALGMFYFLFIKLSLLSALSFFAILLLSLSNLFKYSFRCFQIKHQKLCSVSDWFSRKSEWIPFYFKNKKGK